MCHGDGQALYPLLGVLPVLGLEDEARVVGENFERLGNRPSAARHGLHASDLRHVDWPGVLVVFLPNTNTMFCLNNANW